jgi:addiction module HigA family antidote
MPLHPANFAIAVHPGDVLQEMLDERGITQIVLARHLDTDAARINEICRHRRGISVPRAVLLAMAFGSNAALWMNLQKNWELRQVDKQIAGGVRSLKKLA